MSNDVTTQQSNPFSKYAQAASQRTIVGQILKFRKGDWSAGQDDTEIAKGTQFVCNMDELTVGWVKWEDARPVEHVMGRVLDGYSPPPRKTLGDTDQSVWDMDDRGQPRDPWQPTNYLLLKGNGNGTGGDQLYTFPATSKGAINAVATLSGEYGKVMRQKPSEFPIVAIGSGSYKHPDKRFGRIHYPTFEVVGWAPKASFEGALAAADKAAADADDDADPDLADAERAATRYAAAKAKPPRKPLFVKVDDDTDSDVPF